MFKRPVAAVSGRARLAARDLSPDSPQVCLLYESEEERDELARRLRTAGLDTVSWQFVNLGPDKTRRSYLATIGRSPRRLVDVMGAGSVATAAVIGSNWPLIAAAMISIAPLLVVAWLFRGLSPSRVVAAA